MKAVFLGTPAFAVPSLTALIDAGHEVAMVVTQPDRPTGRGGRIEMPPVKTVALKHGLNVIQPEKLRRAEWVEQLRGLHADVFITAAYGQILSKRLLDIPRLGTVNVHASLLPRYRGSAPVQWALINGEQHTGVTTMLTDVGVDTGDVLMQRSTPIQLEETADTLLERLSHIGAELLIETLSRLERGECPRVQQDPGQASYFPMLTKEDGLINWALPAQSIINHTRGVDPWPGAFTFSPNGVLKIYKVCEINYTNYSQKGVMLDPGRVLVSDPKRGLIIACGELTALEIMELKPPSGKQMTAAAYLRGHPLDVGKLLENVPNGGIQ
ncbi:methionyl-tRNA formyltransferase [Clostridia bacterium]|nr:methionyl-tRNA formyltransferase [Clostridia bacterium]